MFSLSLSTSRLRRDSRCVRNAWALTPAAVSIMSDNGTGHRCLLARLTIDIGAQRLATCGGRRHADEQLRVTLSRLVVTGRSDKMKAFVSRRRAEDAVSLTEAHHP